MRKTLVNEKRHGAQNKNFFKNRTCHNHNMSSLGTDTTMTLEAVSEYQISLEVVETETNEENIINHYLFKIGFKSFWNISLTGVVIKESTLKVILVSNCTLMSQKLQDFRLERFSRKFLELTLRVLRRVGWGFMKTCFWRNTCIWFWWIVWVLSFDPLHPICLVWKYSIFDEVCLIWKELERYCATCLSCGVHDKWRVQLKIHFVDNVQCEVRRGIQCDVLADAN